VYSVTGDPEALGFALDLAATVVSDFYDEADGTIYFTRDPDGNAGHGGDDTLFARPQEFTDQSTPSSLGVAAETLALLDGFRTDREFAEVAETVVTTHADRIRASPLEHVSLVRAADRASSLGIEVTIAADAVPDAWRETLGERYLPGALVAPRPRPKTGWRRGSTDLIWTKRRRFGPTATRSTASRPPTSVRGARARRRRPTSTRRWSGWRRGADLSSDAGTSIVRAGGGTFYAPRFGGAIMERHDLLYRLYDEFDVETLREYQSLVDLFPPVDSRVALEHWEDAGEELARLKREIREALPAGATFAEVAAYADREAAFTALDLHARYDRAVNALVLDVDETLRSAGGTDNEIPARRSTC